MLPENFCYEVGLLGITFEHIRSNNTIIFNHLMKTQ